MYPASKSTVCPSWWRRPDPVRFGRPVWVRFEPRGAWEELYRQCQANDASMNFPPVTRRFGPQSTAPSYASYRRRTRRFATQIRRNRPSGTFGLRNASMRRDTEWSMGPGSKKPGLRRHSPSRRIVVVTVPPVDELDLVGLLHVFNSVNRLAGRTIYTIEIVTNADPSDGRGRGRCVDLRRPASLQQSGRRVRLRAPGVPAEHSIRA